MKGVGATAGVGVLVVSPPLAAVGPANGGATEPVSRLILIPPGTEVAGDSGTGVEYGSGITVAVDNGTIVKVVYLVLVKCRVLVVVFSMELSSPAGEEVGTGIAGTGVPGIVGLKAGVVAGSSGTTVV